MLTPRDRRSRTTANSFCGFVLRKGRCRLVHDQDAGIGAERLGDFDELLLADRERADERLRRDVEADQVEIFSRFAVDSLLIDHAESQRLAAEEDVGGDAQIVG